MSSREELVDMQIILEPGAKLRDRYEICELVGQGGMGAVYRALDLRLDGRICAIKEILPAITVPNQSDDTREQLSKQFHTEASVLARLDHPNLPKVSDYFTTDEREYLVMDFVAGKELQENIRETERRNEKLPESEVLKWATQLLDAVDYLHAQDPPVIHRDIKPANIKVTPHGIIKLVDFGLVKMLQDDESRTVTVVQGRGTVAYTPLEQYGNDSFTETRTDLYSVAATLYHCLTGNPPLEAKERFLHPGSLPSIRDINPTVSARVERTIFQALAMHPTDRPESARVMSDQLVGSRMLSATTTPLPTTATSRIQMSWGAIFRQNLALVGAAITLLVLAIALSLFPELP